MKTLDEHNQIMRKVNRMKYGVGVACPKCGAEMISSDDTILASNPPQRNVHCADCGYKGYMTVGSYQSVRM